MRKIIGARELVCGVRPPDPDAERAPLAHILIPDDVTVEFRVPWWLPGKYLGVTLGTAKRPRVHLRDNPPDPRTVWHEMQHVAQLRQRGTLRYYVAWLWDTLLYWYDGNRLELEADRVAREKYAAWRKTW